MVLGGETRNPSDLTETIAFNDLSDVDTTGVSSGDFIQFDGANWVDFDLFATQNTWTANQIFSATNGITIGAGAAGIDYTVTFDGETNDGLITWKEDEDYFEFNDDINMAELTPSKKIIFGGNSETFIRGNDTVSRDLELQAGRNVDIFASSENVAIFSVAGLIIGAGTAGTDYTLTFNGETNDGVITWMEDEDWFEFSDHILLPDNIEIKFGTGDDGSVTFDASRLQWEVPSVTWKLTSIVADFSVTNNSDQSIMKFSSGISETLVIFNDDQTSKDVLTKGDNISSLFRIDTSTDEVSIGSVSLTALFSVDGQNDEIQTIIQANSTQTTDIFVVEASDGTDYFVVESDGTTNIKGEAAGQVVAFVYNDITARSATVALRWGNTPATGSGSDGIVMPSAGSIIAHTTSVDITTATSGDVTFEIEIDNVNASALENEFLSSLGTGRFTVVTNVARDTSGATFTSGQVLSARANETGTMAWDDVFGVILVQLDT